MKNKKLLRVYREIDLFRAKISGVRLLNNNKHIKITWSIDPLKMFVWKR